MKNVLWSLFVCGTVLLAFSGCKKKGCMDTAACNYDPEVKSDDGSCQSAPVWYRDADGDGLGDSLNTQKNCQQPAGYVTNFNDDNDLVVEQKQRAVVTYVGATWCPPCGSYGDPAKVYMEQKHGSDVIILSVQDDDAISKYNEFGPPFGSAFQSFSGSSSIPHAWWSGHGFNMTHRGFSTSASSNNSFADNYINAIKAKSPEAGVSASAVRSGTTITVKTKTKFYSAVSGYQIGVYLLEDSIVATQDLSTGGSAKTAHHNVLRVAANGSTGSLGLTSMGSSFAANQTVEGTYTLTAKSTWNASRLQVAVVLWKGNSADKISNAVVVNVK